MGNLPYQLQRFCRAIIFLACLWAVFCGKSFAQNAFRVIRNIPVQARLLAVDELGNSYVVRVDNTVFRFNENGDSTGFYRSTLNGDIGTVDATNPLRILLYYPDFSKWFCSTGC